MGKSDRETTIIQQSNSGRWCLVLMSAASRYLGVVKTSLCGGWLAGLLAAITGVRVSTTRPTRGASISAMAVSSTATRPTRCGFVRSGLFNYSSLHLFSTLGFAFLTLRMRWVRRWPGTGSNRRPSEFQMGAHHINRSFQSCTVSVTVL